MDFGFVLLLNGKYQIVLKIIVMNNSYEITINGFQVRKINEISVIFGLRYGKPEAGHFRSYEIFLGHFRGKWPVQRHFFFRAGYASALSLDARLPFWLLWPYLSLLKTIITLDYDRF